MSALPRIPATDSIVKPAEQEQTFADWFVDKLTINPEHGGDYKTAVVLRPYDYDSDTLGPADQSIRIEMDDIQTTAAQRAAAGNPGLAQALGAVLIAVAELATDPAVMALREGNVIEITKE